MVFFNVSVLQFVGLRKPEQIFAETLVVSLLFGECGDVVSTDRFIEKAPFRTVSNIISVCEVLVGGLYSMKSKPNSDFSPYDSCCSNSTL